MGEDGLLGHGVFAEPEHRIADRNIGHAVSVRSAPWAAFAWPV
jgi:hypothetical protein